MQRMEAYRTCHRPLWNGRYRDYRWRGSYAITVVTPNEKVHLVCERPILKFKAQNTLRMCLWRACQITSWTADWKLVFLRIDATSKDRITHWNISVNTLLYIAYL
jgi:hypothetical protein